MDRPALPAAFAASVRRSPALAANALLGQRGERCQGPRTGSRAASADSSLRFQRTIAAAEPLRRRACRPRPLVELRIAGVELEVVGRLRYFENRAWRSFSTSARRVGQEVVAGLAGLLELAARVACGLGRRRVAGLFEPGQLVGLDRAGEDAVERVVVLGGDRVELVVVAAGAGDRQAEQAAADDVDPVVDDVVLVVQEPPADASGTPCAASGPGSSPRSSWSAASCSTQEPVEGQVVVERPDDVVAVGVGEGILPLLRGRRSPWCRRSGRRRASAGPSARRSGARPAGGRPAGRRRRATWSASNASTSSAVGGRPSRSNVARRIRVRRSAGGEGVSPSSSSLARTNASTGDADPARILDGGRRTWLDRRERPVGLDPAPRSRPRRCPTAEPRATAPPSRPTAEARRPTAPGSLAFGRHLQFVVRVRDGLDQQALVGLARHDGRAGRPRP